MSDARAAILKNLEEGRLRVIPESPPGGWLPVDPVRDTGAEALESRFIAEAQAAGVRVLSPSDREAAFGLLNNILVEERVVLGWSPKHIPLKGFQEWLSGKGITLLEEPDSSPKVGITGADAVLSTTGSLILTSGPGKSRAASLLPETHVALVQRETITTNFESWLVARRQQGVERLRVPANLVVITGPSRTADIGMELVMGAHGPRHLIAILV